MQWTDAGRTAGGAGAVADELRRVVEQIAMQVVEARRKPDAAGVNLEYRHGGQARRHGSDLRHRAEIAWVAHQAQGRYVTQRVGHALEPRLERLLAERAPQILVDRDPVA